MVAHIASGKIGARMARELRCEPEGAAATVALGVLQARLEPLVRHWNTRMPVHVFAIGAIDESNGRLAAVPIRTS